MITVALPKGRLLPNVLEVVGSTAVPQDRNYQLCLKDKVSGTLFKPRSIPQIVAMKMCDIGFCGFDLLMDSPYKEYLTCALKTKHNPVKIVVAAKDYSLPKRPIVIATEYPNVASEWAAKNSLSHIILETYGSTEAYVPMYADILIDCVETGQTIKDNGLQIIEELFYSTTVGIVHKDISQEKLNELKENFDINGH